MTAFPVTLKGVIWAAARIALAIYVLVGLLLFFFQERLLFFPEKLNADFRFKFDAPFDEHGIEFGGLKADSLLFRAPESKGTILYFHGNAGSLRDWGEVAAELSARLKWNVWIIDYPGFGRSEGQTRSEDQLHGFAAAMFQAARQHLGENEKLIPFGRSIGSGLAVKLAKDNQVAALILETPYTSLRSLAQALYPWAPLFLLKYKLRSDLWIRDVKAPVLVVHGNRDEVIPFAQGQALAELVPSAAFAEVDGGHHNDLSAFDDYWAALEKFIAGI